MPKCYENKHTKDWRVPFHSPNLSILPVCMSTTLISIPLNFDKAVISMAPGTKEKLNRLKLKMKFVSVSLMSMPVFHLSINNSFKEGYPSTTAVCKGPSENIDYNLKKK